MNTLTNTVSEMTLDLEMKAHNSMEMKNIMEMKLSLLMMKLAISIF